MCGTVRPETETRFLPFISAQETGQREKERNAEKNADGNDEFFASPLIHDTAQFVLMPKERSAFGYNLTIAHSFASGFR